MGQSAHCTAGATSARWTDARLQPKRAPRLARRPLRDRGHAPHVPLALRADLPPPRAEEPPVRLRRPLDQVPLASRAKAALLRETRCAAARANVRGRSAHTLIGARRATGGCCLSDSVEEFVDRERGQGVDLGTAARA